MSKLSMWYRDQQVTIEVTKNEDGLYRWTCNEYPDVIVENMDQSTLVDLITVKLDCLFDQKGIKSNELELEQEFKKYDIGMS